MVVVNTRTRKGYGIMAVLELLVQAAELLQAANQINQAVETYEEAVETCKSAAADLASKWEGEAKEAFVAFQENAYSWWRQMIQIVRNMISVIRKVIDLYNQMEDAVKGVVQ